MIEIEAWVEGTMPLLQHRMVDGALETPGTRGNLAGERDDPRNVAERGIYRFPSNQIGVPGSSFARLLREAGGAHKLKGSRKSAKFVVPAAVLIRDEVAPLFFRDRKTAIVDFEVDSRPVVIPATKGRVMRHRARFNDWSVKISLRINESILAESFVRQLLVEGGEQIGLGDFRIEKGGSFGTFGLVVWAVVSEPKPITPAKSRNGEVRRDF